MEKKGTSSKPIYEPIKAKEITICKDKGKIDISTLNHYIKFFRYLGRSHVASKCPIKRTMITKVVGEVETDSKSEDEMSPLEKTSGKDDDTYVVEGKMIVLR